jgi:hypothetical protein
MLPIVCQILGLDWKTVSEWDYQRAVAKYLSKLDEGRVDLEIVSDLDAVHALEQKLYGGLLYHQRELLMKMCGNSRNWRNAISATALQRCEALVVAFESAVNDEDKSLHKAIADGQPPDDWIKCSDRTPMPSDGDSFGHVLWWHEELGCITDKHNNYLSSYTHWTRLPRRPAN